MKYWHSFFEIFKFPIQVLFVAFFLVGLGNLLIDPFYGLGHMVRLDFVYFLGEMISRVGIFTITTFPLLVLLRLVSRKGNQAISIVSGLIGYITILVVSIYGVAQLPSSAYSSILGISISSSQLRYMASGTHYPIQYGLISPLIVAMITLWRFSKMKKRNVYGIFGFIPSELACAISTIIWCMIFGVLLALGWPYVFAMFMKVVDFIKADTINPVNLTLYGIVEKLLQTIWLPTMIRQPFWYGNSGGTWVNVAGTVISGDAQIWTAQILGGIPSGMTGRFFTPTYIVNLFAIPSMLLAFYSLSTDKLEKRRTWIVVCLGIIASFLGGTSLPLQLMLLLLAPSLFLFHIGYTGLLYGFLQSMRIYLGFRTNESYVFSAMPGSLMEFLGYFQYASLHQRLLMIIGIGVFSTIVYFVVTKLYFQRFAMDVFRVNTCQTMAKEIIGAIGGVENIRLVNSNFESLTIKVQDEELLDVKQLHHQGVIQIRKTPAGHTMYLGAKSTMLRKEIQKIIRQKTRS